MFMSSCRFVNHTSGLCSVHTQNGVIFYLYGFGSPKIRTNMKYQYVRYQCWTNTIKLKSDIKDRIAWIPIPIFVLNDRTYRSKFCVVCIVGCQLFPKTVTPSIFYGCIRKHFRATLKTKSTKHYNPSRHDQFSAVLIMIAISHSVQNYVLEKKSKHHVHMPNHYTFKP